MARDRLTKKTVVSEIRRLLGPEVLGWWKTKEGIEWHTLDKNTSHIYGIYAAMLEHLVEDAEREGMRPGYILGYLALRVWGSADDQTRADLKKLIPNWDVLDQLFLDDDMERHVKARDEKLQTP